MNKVIPILIVIILLAMTGCKKDNENSNSNNNNFSSTNYFEYDGQTYNLNKGFFIEYGPYTKNDVYEFDVYMYAGMTIYNPDSVIGSGNVIGFCIYSPEIDIKPGTYDYSIEYGEPFTYCFGHFQLKFISSQDWIEVKNGSVIISIGSNNTFDVSFECISVNGKNVKGRYVGKPVFFDATNDAIFKNF